MTDQQQHLQDRARRLSKPDRFAYHRGEIEDAETALRIEEGQPWRVQHMADGMNDLIDAANSFSNQVYEGTDPNFDKLDDAIHVAEGAIYEWGKNNARLAAWKDENA